MAKILSCRDWASERIELETLVGLEASGFCGVSTKGPSGLASKPTAILK